MTLTTPSPISDQAEGMGAAIGEHIDIVFDQVAVDGAPPEYSFIEVENSQRASIKFGEWVHRDDGCWVLRISTAPTTGSAPECTCAVRLMPGQIGATHSQDCPVTHWCRAAFKASGENAQASPAASGGKDE